MEGGLLKDASVLLKVVQGGRLPLDNYLLRASFQGKTEFSSAVRSSEPVWNHKFFFALQNREWWNQALDIEVLNSSQQVVLKGSFYLKDFRDYQRQEDEVLVTQSGRILQDILTESG